MCVYYQLLFYIARFAFLPGWSGAELAELCREAAIVNHVQTYLYICTYIYYQLYILYFPCQDGAVRSWPGCAVNHLRFTLYTHLYIFLINLYLYILSFIILHTRYIFVQDGAGPNSPSCAEKRPWLDFVSTCMCKHIQICRQVYYIYIYVCIDYSYCLNITFVSSLGWSGAELAELCREAAMVWLCGLTLAYTYMQIGMHYIYIYILSIIFHIPLF